MNDLRVIRLALMIRRSHSFSWLQCFRVAVFVNNRLCSHRDFIRSCCLSGRRSDLLGLGIGLVNRF